jgi:lipopolysaccharide/colanic/teichoic acid biosynthesis glycosyltransferase
MVKRVFDIIFAIILIVLLMPLYIIVALVIFIDMGRPILFRQVRPGLNEKLFTIYKFRTMSDEKSSDGSLLPDEKRLTKLGKVIRALSLDELPQLFNVLKGDMSFVGPRPLLVEYLPLYSEREKKRHSVKPGITGWAQVNGRNAITWSEKFEYDLWYVENYSFLLDMKILLLTLLKVLQRSDIHSKESVTMEKFKGSQNG